MKYIVDFRTMLAYGLADAAEIPARQRTDTETQDFLESHNLKEALKIVAIGG